MVPFGPPSTQHQFRVFHVCSSNSERPNKVMIGKNDKVSFLLLNTKLSVGGQVSLELRNMLARRKHVSITSVKVLPRLTLRQADASRR